MTVPQDQENGPADKLVVDLLDITHEMLVRGVIVPTATQTAEEARDELITLMKGAGVSSGQGDDLHLVVTYGTNSYNMFISKLAIKEKPLDYDPTTGETDLVKYDVQITLLEGVSAVSG